MNEAYKYDYTVGLVTTASCINQNIALLKVENYWKADSLAVIHEGFINYIPLLNTTRRSKYVPISVGCDRGKGFIKNIKWLKFGSEIYFVTLSTIGLQLFDVELTDISFEYNFENLKEKKTTFPLPVGACIIDEYLCVGANTGVLLLFKNIDGNIKLTSTTKIEPFFCMVGADSYVITISRDSIRLYVMQNGMFKYVNSRLEERLCSVAEVTDNLLFLGYHSGELAIISPQTLQILSKKMVHDQEITGLDYSESKSIILTASLDMYLKVWKYDRKSETLTCQFELKQETNPPCGIMFTNKWCTEFCVTLANSLRVDFYVEKRGQKESSHIIEEESLV